MLRNRIGIERLTVKDVEELSKKRNGGELFFSLYVGAKPGRNFVTEANSVISQELQRIRKRNKYSEKELKKIERFSLKLKDWLRLLKIPHETKSIAFFCGARNFGKFYHVPSYIPSKFVVESDFYVHPFIEAMEDYPKYLVVVLERDKARFFNFFLGEIEKISEIISSDVPQRIKAARGLNESNIQSHIEDHENSHLKKVSKETENYFKFGRNGFGYLIIGAHKRSVEKFVKMLGEKSKKKLIGSYPITPNYKIDEIKKRSQGVVKEYEEELEEKLINDILNTSAKVKNSTVLGINLTLDSFHFHNVDTFVVGKNYKEPGFLCPKCHYISSYEKICPNDKSEMIKVDDIVDEIIEEAIANKIKIKHFEYPHEKFDKFGIGAVLKTVS